MFTKYREISLPLIPLRRNEKSPISNDWSKWSKVLPTIEETELWDRLWENGHRNVGLVLGPSGGIMALDFDTDDKELLSLAPPSPVIKRGNKGETRFYRPCEGLQSRSPNGLDILWTGRQTVLPPSIHPISKKPYVWITPDTLEDIKIQDLPIVDLSFVQKYVSLFEERYPNLCRKNKDGQSVGRNNRLKDIVWAKRSSGESEQEIIDSIYKTDLYENNPRLFLDQKEGFKGTTEDDAIRNAWKFVSNVTRSFINKGDGPLPSDGRIELLLDKKSIEPKKFTQLDYPEPKGKLGMLYRMNLGYGIRQQKSLALGGAVALASVIIANRFRFGSIWPNLYILNVAQTGAGKSFPQKIIKKMIVQDLGCESLIGSGGFRSGSSIIKDLEVNRERIDLIDEASALFSLIEGGGPFQKEMDDLLCSLYSDSSEYFIGPGSVGQKQIRVWHPCVTMFMSTTPNGLRQSISNALATKGFFPRCLLFIDYEYGQQQKPFLDQKLYDAVLSEFKHIRGMQCSGIGRPGDILNSRPDPVDIECTEGAIRFLEDREFAWNEDIEKSDTSDLEKVFLTRAGEQARKLALIHGSLSNMRIEIEDAVWACQVVDTMRKNASHIMPLLGAENRNQGSMARLYSYISAAGVITHKELIAKSRFLSKRERNEMLESLVEEGVIKKAKDEHGALWVING